MSTPSSTWFHLRWLAGVALASSAIAKDPTPVPYPHQIQGVSSCAAMACHGGETLGAKGSEYTTWIARDPHARAYEVLLTPRSKNMARLLGIDRPETSNRCLNCHATNPDTGKRAPLFSVTDGVSCESCHGPAEKWLVEHNSRDWDQRSIEDKNARGFINTKNLLVRVQTCLPCHVGGSQRDVNHDLIAAGHPRLVFEYGTFLANYPKHYSDRADHERNADQEIRAWLLGQAAVAEAALQLTEQRARSGTGWPELAELDCAACHHALSAPSWRQQNAPLGEKPGRLLLSPWNRPDSAALAGSSPLLKELADAQRQLDASILTGPASTTADHARKGAALAHRLAEQYDRSPPAANADRSLIDHALKADPAALSRTWDRAAQLYLLLAALHDHLLWKQSLASTKSGSATSATESPVAKDPKLKALSESLDKARKALEYPKGYDSPKDFQPSRFEPIARELLQRLAEVSRS